MVSSGPSRPRTHGLRAVFALPGYRRLWAARTVSQWGDVAATVALGLLVFDLTGSGLGVVGVVAAEIVPVLLLAPVAGVVVDRLPRRTVMIAADIVRAVLAGSLPLVADHVGAVYAVAAAMSAASVFFNPAAGAVLPNLVDRDRLIAANSGIWTAAVLSQIALAPVTGLLVTVAGVNVAFWINAVSYLQSAVLLLRLPEPARSPGVKAESMGGRWRGRWTAAAAGVRHITADRRLAALAIAQTLAALSAGATSALLVVYVRDHLHAPPAGYGIAIGAIGVGAVLGPLVLVRLIRDPTRAGWVFGPYALRGGVDLTLAAVSTVPAAAGALAVYGLGTSTGAVTFNSLLQGTVPDAVRGRVMATFDITWQMGRLASLGIGAVLADQIGIQAVYVLGGVLLLLAAALAPLARAQTARPAA
ncbi:MFS transporter [Micromonospora aurantiaca (nom. illeg.)]|uniref:MFS transporter n=1 Tax=Micromonospora aurantiaca (nom. illeg.) TaxID=47850 RepID=UPI00165715DF|nr:MFS transporter [Micromonospora aurantiaca]MBC9001738.1 MFS transporter [Micromonospora aurantiaca]